MIRQSKFLILSVLYLALPACPPDKGDSESATSDQESNGSLATTSTSESVTTGPATEWAVGTFYCPFGFEGAAGASRLTEISLFADGTATGQLKSHCTDAVQMFVFSWMEVEAGVVQLMPVTDGEGWFFQDPQAKTVLMSPAGNGMIHVSSPEVSFEYSPPFGLYAPGSGCLVVMPEGGDCFFESWAVPCP